MAEVDVELYIEGKGPVHVLKLPLRGWDNNRLDLEQLMTDYNLRAIYAFSMGTGRGQRLFYNSRNGLSLVPYSGKPDSIIRLDGEPKRSPLAPVTKILAGLTFITLMIACCFTTMPRDWVKVIRDLGGGRIAWVGCFIAMIVIQLSRHGRRPKAA